MSSDGVGVEVVSAVDNTPSKEDGNGEDATSIHVADNKPSKEEAGNDEDSTSVHVADNKPSKEEGHEEDSTSITVADNKPSKEEGHEEDAMTIRILEAAILSAEESLHRSVVSDGPSSTQTRAIATDLVLAYNHLAVRLLSGNDIKGSLLLLQKAKLLTSRERPYLGNARLRARAVTLNNLGCLMKKWGKPRVGVTYLARALRMEAKVPGGADNPAGTHANMSAALSTLGMHRAAAVYAVHAVGLASRAMEQAGAVAAEDDDAPPADGGGGGGGGAGDTNPDHTVAGPADAAAADDAADAAADAGGGGGGVAGAAGGIAGVVAAAAASADAAAGAAGAAGDSRVQNDGRVDSAAAHDRKGQEPMAPLTSNNDDADPGVSAFQREDKETFLPEANRGGEGDSPGGRAEDEGTAAGAAAASSHEKESTAGGLLAVAYFNLAVERDHLGQPEAALEAYEKARATAALHLDPESPVAKGIEFALETASGPTLSSACTPRTVVQSSCLSFPSIGKLYFGPRPQRVTPRGRGRSPRRLSPKRQWDQKDEDEEEEEEGEEEGAGDGDGARQRARLNARQDARQGAGQPQSPLERAYTSQQPSPPSHRRDRRARVARLSRKSPPSVVAGGGRAGPQRAGRWARDAQGQGPVPPQKAQTSSSGGGGGTVGEIQASDKRRVNQDDDIMWRARACAEWGCSPNDARRAQLSGRDADGRTANDHGSPKQLSSRWVE